MKCLLYKVSTESLYCIIRGLFKTYQENQDYKYFSAKCFWDKVFDFFTLANMSSNKDGKVIYVSFSKMSQPAKYCSVSIYYFEKEGRHFLFIIRSDLLAGYWHLGRLARVGCGGQGWYGVGGMGWGGVGWMGKDIYSPLFHLYFPSFHWFMYSFSHINLHKMRQ